MNRSDELRERALTFLRLAATGKVDEAYATYAHPRFRHHNPYFSAGASALREGMAAAAKQHPDTTIDVKRTIVDGDVVAVHSHVKHGSQERGFAVVHIARFDGDRIAELWDIVQPVPENSPNTDGIF